MPASNIPGKQARHHLRAFTEIGAQEDLNITTLIKLQARFQSGLRENRGAHRPGDFLRFGAIINHGAGGAEIHVIADPGHGEPFLVEQRPGPAGQVPGSVAVPDLDGRAQSISDGQDRWRR